MSNAIRINPFVFLQPDAITSDAQAQELATGLFTHVPVQPGIGWIYDSLSYAPAPGHGEPQRVHTFEAAYFDAMATSFKRTSDVLYVDEDGLSNNINDVWIAIRGAWQPFAGGGLVVGTTPSGNSTNPKQVTSEWLANNTIILVQNLLYIPRIGRMLSCRTSAVRYSSYTKLLARDHVFWNISAEDL